MNSFRLSVICICSSAFLPGCNTQHGQNVQQIMLSEVTFLVPRNLSVTKAEEMENGAVFEIEGLWGELKNGRLVVMGNSYGEVKAGDEVQFNPDGTFLVNGIDRKPAGLGDSAVECEEVLFFFPGQTVKQLPSDEGSPIVEMPDGSKYKLTNGGIIIDGHEYGPYAAKTVVKIDPDGSVAFNP